MFQKMKSLYARGKQLVAGAVTAAAAVVLGITTPAHATDVDDLFLAVDLTGVSGNIKTLLIAFIVIGLMFLGYRYVKRTMRGA